MNTVKEAKIAGMNDRLDGYSFQPSFREGTEEYKAYKEGYYDTHQLHTSTRTH